MWVGDLPLCPIFRDSVHLKCRHLALEIVLGAIELFQMTAFPFSIRG